MSLGQFVVVASRAQGLLSMDRGPVGGHSAYICCGLCSGKFYSLSEGGRELMPRMHILH